MQVGANGSPVRQRGRAVWYCAANDCVETRTFVLIVYCTPPSYCTATYCISLVLFGWQYLSNATYLIRTHTYCSARGRVDGTRIPRGWVGCAFRVIQAPEHVATASGKHAAGWAPSSRPRLKIRVYVRPGCCILRWDNPRPPDQRLSQGSMFADLGVENKDPVDHRVVFL